MKRFVVGFGVFGLGIAVVKERDPGWRRYAEAEVGRRGYKILGKVERQRYVILLVRKATM